MGDVKTIIIGLVIFSGLLIGLTTFSGNLFTNYGYTNVTNISYIDTAKDVDKLTTNLKESIEKTEITGIGPIDASLAIAAGTYGSLKIMLSSLNIVTSLIYDISYLIGIPSWVTAMLLSIIILLIIFGIIKAVTKVDV